MRTTSAVAKIRLRIDNPTGADARLRIRTVELLPDEPEHAARRMKVSSIGVFTVAAGSGGPDAAVAELAAEAPIVVPAGESRAIELVLSGPSYRPSATRYFDVTIDVTDSEPRNVEATISDAIRHPLRR